MYTRKATQHGKPQSVVRDDQTGGPRGTDRARWGGGEDRSTGEAGNAGEGKGPQFKTDARRVGGGSESGRISARQLTV
jgi:hypothetical protein